MLSYLPSWTQNMPIIWATTKQIDLLFVTMSSKPPKISPTSEQRPLLLKCIDLKKKVSEKYLLTSRDKNISWAILKEILKF